MTLTASGRLLASFVLSLGLAFPLPSFSAPPDFFESLRNNPDTEPSPTDPKAADTRPRPSLRKTPPESEDTGDVADTDPGPPSPEVRSSLEPNATDTAVRIVIPPSNGTLRSGDTSSAAPSPGKSSSRRSVDTGVRFSREGRAFEQQFFVAMRWPGVSVGLRESPYTLEVKYLEEADDVKITGLRLYHHLLRVDATNVYWGLDLARVSFEGDVSEGTGNSTGLYAGFEKRLWGPFSWSLDLGPYYIHLRDDATNITAEGLEFTLTTGLNVGFL